MKVCPRQYQIAGLDALVSELKERNSTLVDMATGAGKTFLFAWACMVLGGRVLVLVHREELLKQAVEKINRVAPDLGVSIERQAATGERRRERGLFDVEPSRVVVASKDTLKRRARLGRYRRDDFDWVIVDEAHRCVRRNPSYMAILNYFCRPPISDKHGGTAKLVGFSASLDRMDGEALGGLFESVAYRYTIAQAIDEGYLLQPHVKKVRINELRLLSLPTSRTPDGERDVTPAALERAMNRREYVYGVAKPLLELAIGPHGRKRQGVVFASSGPQAKLQAEVLNEESPGCAAVCLGEPYQNADERAVVQARFGLGQVQFLVTCDVLTEGWDSDRVEIVVLKPSGSRARIAQMVGRGTRPLNGCVDPWDTPELRRMAIANSPKPHLLVLDPCGVSDQHTLVNVADIFKGRFTPAAPPKPFTPAVATTPSRPDDLDERRAAKNAIETIEAERLRGLKVAVEYDLEDGDMMSRKPSDLAKVQHCPRALIDHPATEAQCRKLEANGVRVPPGMTKKQAHDALTNIMTLENAKPATERQRNILKKFGKPLTVSRGEARKIIDEIAANGWRLPDETQAPAE